MKKSIQQPTLFQLLAEYERKTDTVPTPNLTKNIKSSVFMQSTHQRVSRVGAIVERTRYWTIELHKKIAQHAREQKKVAHQCLQLCDDFSTLGTEFQDHLATTISLGLMNKMNLLVKQLEKFIHLKSQKFTKFKSYLLIKKSMKKIAKISKQVHRGMLIETKYLYEKCSDLVHLLFSSSLKNQIFSTGYLEQKNIHFIAKKLKKLDAKLKKIKQKLVQE